MLNCSGLIRGLSAFSDRIRENSRENLANFRDFREKLAENPTKPAISQENPEILQEIERILAKVRRKQGKREFFWSSVVLSAIFAKSREFVKENQEKTAISWVFNLLSDEKALNKEKAMSFLRDLLENSQISKEKERIHATFHALLFVFLEESGESLENAGISLISAVFARVSDANPLVFGETLEFLAIFKEFLGKSSISLSFMRISWLKSQKLDVLLRLSRENCLEIAKTNEKVEEIADFPKILPTFNKFLGVFLANSAQKLENALFPQGKTFN